MRQRRRGVGGSRRLWLTSLLVAGIIVSCGGKDAPTEIASNLPRGKDVMPGTDVDLPYLSSAMRKATGADSGKSYAGFDTYAYPGDAVMKAWRAEGTYHWVGYYLPSPCHKGRTWVGKRETLKSMGWGTAVVYVGQQTWGTELNPVARGQKAGSDCAASLLTADRGRKDADDAIWMAVSEGFQRGAIIFLDVERMEVIPPAMRAYYKAWTERVLEDGHYVPGIYAHTHNAATIHSDVQGVFAARGRRDIESPFWIAGKGDNFRFTLERDPEDIGHDFATMWQGKIDIVERRAGKKLPIDVNVARTPDPSSPATAAAD